MTVIALSPVFVRRSMYFFSLVYVPDKLDKIIFIGATPFACCICRLVYLWWFYNSRFVFNLEDPGFSIPNYHLKQQLDHLYNFYSGQIG